MCPTIHICDRNVCPPKAVSGPKVSCAKCQSTCFLLCFGFEKCGVNGVKISSASGCNIAMDPNSICFTCTKCDAAFLTDAINDKMESANTTQKQTQQLHDTPKLKASTNNVTISTDSPATNAQLKIEILKMSKSLMGIKRMLDTSSSDLSELKNIGVDTNTMVKSINIKTAELNTDVSTKLNEISSQAQSAMSSQTPSFSSVVREQQNDKRQKLGMKRRIQTEAITDTKSWQAYRQFRISCSAYNQTKTEVR